MLRHPRLAILFLLFLFSHLCLAQQLGKQSTAGVENSIWWWLFMLWLYSMPVWAFLYVAYKFRRCRSRFRYFLLRGILFLVVYGALAIIKLPPLRSAIPLNVQNWVTSGVWVMFLASPFITWRMMRAIKREADNPEEVEQCRRAEEDLLKDHWR